MWSDIGVSFVIVIGSDLTLTSYPLDPFTVTARLNQNKLPSPWDFLPDISASRKFSEIRFDSSSEKPSFLMKSEIRRCISDILIFICYSNSQFISVLSPRLYTLSFLSEIYD